MSKPIRAILLLVPLLLFPGCTRPINRSAERKIREALPSYIGPARVWRAHVDNSAERTLQGRLSTVTIDGEGVLLKETVPIESLHVEMHEVDVDTGRANQIGRFDNLPSYYRRAR